MRQKANENPLVQVGLIVVLVVVFAFILFTRILSSGSNPEASTDPTPSGAATVTAEPAAPGASVPTTPAPAEGTTAPESTAPGTAPAAPTAPGAGIVAPGSFTAGKGLPAPVVNAYEDGKAVVLLIVRQAGLDDKPVKAAVNLLRAHPDVEVFITGAKDIARYSRVTNGVSVNQVPALIVIQPKDVSGDIPEASVSYGFRGPESVLQAVNDALYDGRDVPYYPE